MKKTIYYWSPCLAKIATIKATINSAISLAKYSKMYEVKIIDVCGEWSKYKNYLLSKNIKLVNLSFNYYDILPKDGFIKSRISNLIIILISIIPLTFLIKNKKPDYFIMHLITSLPLILLNLINTKTKMILRISGFPKLNYFRKKLWLLAEKKIFKITCPTEDLKDDLLEKNIFRNDKLVFLPDPVINMKEFIKKKIEEKSLPIDGNDKDFFIAVGRLTRQKNFIYLISEFKKFLEIYPNEKLLIFGDGELKKKILSKIKSNGMSDNIKLCGYTENIYKYMLKSKAFILSSLWEDPGFVMIESAMCNLFVISSNCKNGPKEFLLNGKAGLIFKSNIEGELYNKLDEFKKLDENTKLIRKVLAKKNSKKFTLFRHYLLFKNIIN